MFSASGTKLMVIIAILFMFFSPVGFLLGSHIGQLPCYIVGSARGSLWDNLGHPTTVHLFWELCNRKGISKLAGFLAPYFLTYS